MTGGLVSSTWELWEDLGGPFPPCRGRGSSNLTRSTFANIVSAAASMLALIGLEARCAAAMVRGSEHATTNPLNRRFARDHVIVRLAPGVRAPTLIAPQPVDAQPQGAGGEDTEVELRLGRVLDGYLASSIAPASRITPANADLAGRFGLDRCYSIKFPRGTDLVALAG